MDSLTLEQFGAWGWLVLLNDTVYPAPLSRRAKVVRAYLGDRTDDLLDELFATGHLDDLGEGEFEVHGIERMHVARSATPQAVAARVARFRDKTKSEGSETRETDETIHETHDTHKRAPAREVLGDRMENGDLTTARDALAEAMKGIPKPAAKH